MNQPIDKPYHVTIEIKNEQCKGLRLLEKSGVDLCMVIRFSPSFRKITASEFLRNILIKKINPKVVVVGRNFTFGSNACGNWRMLEDYSKKLNKEGIHFLERISAGSQQMGQLIDDLLSLSRMARKETNWEIVNLSKLAKEASEELKERDSNREIEFKICKGRTILGDPQLLRIVINNLR